MDAQRETKRVTVAHFLPGPFAGTFEGIGMGFSLIAQTSVTD